MNAPFQVRASSSKEWPHRWQQAPRYSCSSTLLNWDICRLSVPKHITDTKTYKWYENNKLVPKRTFGTRTDHWYQNKRLVPKRVIGTTMVTNYDSHKIRAFNHKNNTKTHKLNKRFTFKKIEEFEEIKAMVGKMVSDRCNLYGLECASAPLL
jgi:hypothetical protein